MWNMAWHHLPFSKFEKNVSVLHHICYSGLALFDKISREADFYSIAAEHVLAWCSFFSLFTCVTLCCWPIPLPLFATLSPPQSPLFFLLNFFVSSPPSSSPLCRPPEASLSPPFPSFVTLSQSICHCLLMFPSPTFVTHLLTTSLFLQHLRPLSSTSSPLYIHCSPQCFCPSSFSAQSSSSSPPPSFLPTFPPSRSLPLSSFLFVILPLSLFYIHPLPSFHSFPLSLQPPNRKTNGRMPRWWYIAFFLPLHPPQPEGRRRGEVWSHIHNAGKVARVNGVSLCGIICSVSVYQWCDFHWQQILLLLLFSLDLLSSNKSFITSLQILSDSEI